MIAPIPFLVGAGPLPDARMRAGCLLLASAWGVELSHHRCSENPHQVLGLLPPEGGMVRLSGDPAMFHPDGGSWLEALGAWRQPTILMVSPLPSGEIPGVAPAYVSLCAALDVPLIGVLQLGGPWNLSLRRSDGLPWFGLLPDDPSALSAVPNGGGLQQGPSLEEVVVQLRRRLLLSSD